MKKSKNLLAIDKSHSKRKQTDIHNKLSNSKYILGR